MPPTTPSAAPRVRRRTAVALFATTVIAAISAVTISDQPALAAGSNLLINPGFESGASGWTNTSTAAFTQTTSPHGGANNLAHYSPTSWSVNTVQTVTGLSAGTYTLTAWIQNWGVTNAGLEAYNCGDVTQSVDLPVTNGWQRIALIVSVRSSACTVGIWSASSTSSLVADDFEFRQMTAGSGGAMPAGGDITYRRMTASSGGRWADSGGTQRDVLDILKARGINLARIRIYNQPGNTVNSGGTNYRLQPGWQDLADAVQNAKDAKARGMKIFISLHYSDFWTNPSLQRRPNAWAGYSQAQLESATYAFTRTVMTTLTGNGIVPDFVSIGNETNTAIMDISRTGNPAGYYGLFKQGSTAVRATSPSSKIVVHLTAPDRTLYSSWINGARTYGLDYDILGVSLYPFWTNMSIASMANFATWVSNTSGKKAMVCEVGYPWTLKPFDSGTTTMIQDNALDADGPENYGATPAGQLRYMREYLRAMADTGRVAAVSYWDPLWIDLSNGVDTNGWVFGGDNAVEDTTFFSYANPHVELPGLAAFQTW